MELPMEVMQRFLEVMQRFSPKEGANGVVYIIKKLPTKFCNGKL